MCYNLAISLVDMKSLTLRLLGMGNLSIARMDCDLHVSRLPCHLLFPFMNKLFIIYKPRIFTF